MIALLLMTLFGLAVGMFAIQNTIGTTVTIFSEAYQLPLYFVIIGSMLLGILAASIIGMVNGVINMMALHRKDRQISSSTHDSEDLQKRIDDLEAENVLLRQDKKNIILEKNAEIDIKDEKLQATRPSFIDNLRQNFK